MKRLFLCLLPGLAVVLPAAAQQTFTLRQSIELAQRQSPAAEVARLTFARSRWSFRAFRAQYLPAFSLTGEVPGLQRSIEDVVQDDGTSRYVERNRTFGRASLAVNQPIALTGGRLFISSALSRLDTEFQDQGFTQWQSAPLLVGLTQPLFQFNEMKWDRRTEPMRYTLARRAYAEDLEAVAVDVTGRFFDVYLAQMNLDIATFNVAVNDTIYQLSTGRFNIGTIAENDLLQSELQLLNARSDQATARIAYQEALQRLKLALDLRYDARLDIVPPAAVPALQIDPDEAVAQARRNHPAFLTLAIEAVEAEREVARARGANGFSASLSALFGLNQSAGAFDGVYRDPLNQQQFTVNFSVPLYRWGRGKAEVEAAVAARARVERDAALRRKELEQEVYFEALQQDLLQQQVRIAAKADTVAARRFDVAKSRYLIGKIDITDLFNAQREKDTARRAYIQTLRQFWTSYFNLRRLTLYDFARREPLTGRVD